MPGDSQVSYNLIITEARYNKIGGKYCLCVHLDLTVESFEPNCCCDGRAALGSEAASLYFLSQQTDVVDLDIICDPCAEKHRDFSGHIFAPHALCSLCFVAQLLLDDRVGRFCSRDSNPRMHAWMHLRSPGCLLDLPAAG